MLLTFLPNFSVFLPLQRFRLFSQVMKQKSFKDFVVDARTGRPLDLTDEQKDTLKREEMIQEVSCKEIQFGHQMQAQTKALISLFSIKDL